MAVGSTTQIPLKIESALKKAAAITGTDFQYLVDTAERESGFRSGVKAPTSSASGLFQFIESTWLQMVKEKGAEFGLEDAAKAISKSSSGQYRVENSTKRQEILALRNKPEIAALMAGAFTQQNADYLEGQIGRKPTSGELYIAHFLGAGNGGKLIKASSLQPEMKAADLFPSAAKSNKSLFYRRGKPVSVKGLYQNLVRRHSVKQVVVAQSGHEVKPKVVQELPSLQRPIQLQGAADYDLKVLGAGSEKFENHYGQIFDQNGKDALFSSKELPLQASKETAFFHKQAQPLFASPVVKVSNLPTVTPDQQTGLQNGSDIGNGSIGVWDSFSLDHGKQLGVSLKSNQRVSSLETVSQEKEQRPILETGRLTQGLLFKG